FARDNYLVPIADENERRPIKRCAVSLAGDHSQLRATQRARGGGAFGAKKPFVEVCHEIGRRLVCNRPETDADSRRTSVHERARQTHDAFATLLPPKACLT